MLSRTLKSLGFWFTCEFINSLATSYIWITLPETNKQNLLVNGIAVALDTLFLPIPWALIPTGEYSEGQVMLSPAVEVLYRRWTWTLGSLILCKELLANLPIFISLRLLSSLFKRVKSAQWETFSNFQIFLLYKHPWKDYPEQKKKLLMPMFRRYAKHSRRIFSLYILKSLFFVQMTLNIS